MKQWDYKPTGEIIQNFLHLMKQHSEIIIIMRLY